MKMAGLCWMAVVLPFILSMGNSLDVLDQNMLAKIVKVIKKYNIEGQFSLAANIPEDQDPNKLENVFENDPIATVKEKVSNGEVYQGTNVVAAKFKKFEKYTEHAEARVLDNIKPLADRSKGNSLVFYSYLSPCGAKCTNTDNPHNILKKINEVIPKWKQYAFVFSTVFDMNGGIKKTDIVEALNQLRNSQIGHNIFRCYNVERRTNVIQCTKCWSAGKIIDQCVNNEA